MATVNAGDRFEQVLVQDLKRTTIVQYAGASGDYNPLHSDERFAKEVAGYPSVFAHGMLTMGMTGRLLTDVQRAVYPVEVEGQVRTTVELHSVSGRWEVARMGGAQKIRAMDKQRRSTMKARGLRSSDFFEVRIPALNLSFLGHHDEDGLRLTPLADDASLKLQAGRSVLASELLTQLVPLAQATPSDMP